MQKWLDNDDILLYLTHNKEKAVDAKRFGRTLKSKINKWMITSDGRYCDRYLVNLADEYNKSYHRCIGKKPIYTDYSPLTEGIKMNLKPPNMWESK